jgi:ATP synthase protein I
MMPKFSESLRKVAPYLNLGAMIAGCMVAGVLLGYWLDKELETSPWMVLGGSILGIVSGFYHFFKVVMRLDKKARDEKDGKAGDDG